MHCFSKHCFSKDGTSCHYYFQDSFGQATIVAHCLHEQEPKVRKEAADFHSSPERDLSGTIFRAGDSRL